MKKKRNQEIFPVYERDHLPLLRAWLTRIDFNVATYPHRDRRGLPFIGLAQSDGVGGFQKRGIVVAKTDSIFAEAIDLVCEARDRNKLQEETSK